MYCRHLLKLNPLRDCRPFTDRLSYATSHASRTAKGSEKKMQRSTWPPHSGRTPPPFATPLVQPTNTMHGRRATQQSIHSFFVALRARPGIKNAARGLRKISAAAQLFPLLSAIAAFAPLPFPLHPSTQDRRQSPRVLHPSTAATCSFTSSTARFEPTRLTTQPPHPSPQLAFRKCRLSP